MAPGVPRRSDQRWNSIKSCQVIFSREGVRRETIAVINMGIPCKYVGTRHERPSYEFQPAVKHLDKLCCGSRKGNRLLCSHSTKALESDTVVPLSMPLWLMVQGTSHLNWKWSRAWCTQEALFNQHLQVPILVLTRWGHQPLALETDLSVHLCPGFSWDRADSGWYDAMFWF